MCSLLKILLPKFPTLNSQEKVCSFHDTFVVITRSPFLHQCHYSRSASHTSLQPLDQVLRPVLAPAPPIHPGVLGEAAPAPPPLEQALRPRALLRVQQPDAHVDQVGPHGTAPEHRGATAGAELARDALRRLVGPERVVGAVPEPFEVERPERVRGRRAVAGREGRHPWAGGGGDLDGRPGYERPGLDLIAGDEAAGAARTLRDKKLVSKHERERRRRKT